MIKKRKRVLLVFFCLFVFLPLLVWFWYAFLKTANPELKKFEGNYLMDGGRSLLVVRFDKRKGLYIPDRYQKFAPIRFDKTIPHTIKIKKVNKRLVFTQSALFTNMGFENDTRIRFECVIKPSKDNPGHWDLESGTLGFFPVINKTDVNFLNELLTGLVYIVKSQSGNQQGGFAAKPKIAKVNSYAINVPEDGVIEYFESHFLEARDSNSLIWAEEISSNYPDNPILQLYKIEMEAIAGDADVALKEWIEWREKFKDWKDHPVWEASNFVGQTVNDGLAIKNGFDKKYVLATMDLIARLNWLKSLNQLDHLITEPEYLITNPTYLQLMQRMVPDFLDIQTMVKTSRIIAIFELFKGNNQESLELLKGAYRIGLDLNSQRLLISTLIGILTRMIVIKGFETYALNGCRTMEDLENLWVELEKIEKIPIQGEIQSLKYKELDAIIFHHGLVLNHTYSGVNDEFGTRQLRTDSCWELLKAAILIKHFLYANGRFPESDEKFEVSGVEDLPMDPFSGKRLLVTDGKFNSMDARIVYSLGPDRDDDGAQIEYDPTNGTISNGDISLKVPFQREFPFPEGGVRANSAYELLMQFPNGLPTDVFSGLQGSPLSIVVSSSELNQNDTDLTSPLTIFSYGPDRDDNRYYNDEKPNSVQALVPESFLKDRSNRKRKFQNVFLPSSESNPELGWYQLEVFYDPTNGTTSEGDLYLEIPPSDKGFFDLEIEEPIQFW